METRLKPVLYTLQDKITLLNEIARQGGRSSRLARGGFATVDFNVEKKKIMNGDSGQIEFERGGVNRPRFSYNAILEYQSRNHFSKLKTTLRYSQH